MKALNDFYKKSELGFALLWIGLYVLLLSLADGLSQSLGVEKLLSAPLAAAFSVFLYIWVKKTGSMEKYGLGVFRGKAGDYLYFIPLFILVSMNLWGGLAFPLSPLETFLYIFSMLFVGFLEELIFRGFLFQALLKSNSPKMAILIASLTFGIGHAVNLLNGAELLATLLQLVYACAVGFMFTVLVYRSKNLWPCILCHSGVNALSVFSRMGETTGLSLFSAAVMTILSLAYGIRILRKIK